MTTVAAAAFSVAVLAAVAQAVTGFGFAMVAVPLLAVAIGPRDAVVAATGLSALLSAYATVRFRGHVAWRPTATISAAAVAAMPFGLLALLWASERMLTGLIGGVLLLSLVFVVRPVRLPRRRRYEVAAGLLSGALLTSTGVNGPPLVVAFHNMQLPPAVFRATLLATLCFQDAVALTALGVVEQVTTAGLVAVAAGLPGLALGWVVGDRVFARFGAEQFRVAILVMLTLSGFLAVWQAVHPA